MYKVIIFIVCLHVYLIDLSPLGLSLRAKNKYESNYWKKDQLAILQLFLEPEWAESIAHEAEGLMGYWFRGYEGERNNCFSKIQLVG